MLKKRVEAVIDTAKIRSNFARIKEIAGGSRVIAVVKADAYGHGASECAHIIEECGGDMFAVACVEEGVDLRESGVRGDILILGVTPAEQAPLLVKYDLIQAVGSAGYAGELAAWNMPLRIHIKIDTGMSRLGLYCHAERDITAARDNVAAIISHSELRCEGIFTHFACSDDTSSKMTERQYGVFTALCSACADSGLEVGMRHCCNSAALINYPYMKLDAVRAGIIMYGLTPDPGMKLSGFEPCMSLVARVAQINHISAGDTVSYGASFTAKRDMTTATVSIGYADGFSRLLSGRASTVINGKKAVTIGKICMDLCIVDVTDIDCRPGDEAIVIGDGQTADELAAMMGTINYELICSVRNRVPRRYI